MKRRGEEKQKQEEEEEEEEAEEEEDTLQIATLARGFCACTLLFSPLLFSCACPTSARLETTFKTRRIKDYPTRAHADDSLYLTRQD